VPGLDLIGQARNGVEAIDSIRTLRPDAVILDIRMPKKNGIDVLKTIKGEKEAPLVIIFTSYPYPQYRDTCLSAGADFFFDKACDVEQLLQVLQALAQTTRTTIGGKSCIHAQ
jgi:YesN/AraC family two-component response regulator